MCIYKVLPLNSTNDSMNVQGIDPFAKENIQMANKHNKYKMGSIVCLREITSSNSCKLPTFCPQKRLNFERLTLPNVGKEVAWMGLSPITGSNAK